MADSLQKPCSSALCRMKKFVESIAEVGFLDTYHSLIYRHFDKFFLIVEKYFSNKSLFLLFSKAFVLFPESSSGVPHFFDRNKILSGGDLSHYQVPHCIRVFFYFVWFVFIHHNFQFYFELCTNCNILDIYPS